MDQVNYHFVLLNREPRTTTKKKIMEIEREKAPIDFVPFLIFHFDHLHYLSGPTFPLPPFADPFNGVLKK